MPIVDPEAERLIGRQATYLNLQLLFAIAGDVDVSFPTCVAGAAESGVLVDIPVLLRPVIELPAQRDGASGVLDLDLFRIRQITEIRALARYIRGPDQQQRGD